ncbi:hypothetical protein CVT25_009594 [Psilocybe cyanescens]|uniref:Glutathione S-transferase C-terminal domain-containing protein n=1 Tax=Psilocybe cyanescens TaxID=93625 RepID=A0A409XDJ8_PSICY|nr:hypothetical protein CVT25_009594 [Psilocybe cyanescens]
MQGQVNQFNNVAPHFNVAPEQVKYPQKCYLDETRQLYSVLESHLAAESKPFIMGEKFTLADIKAFP